MAGYIVRCAHVAREARGVARGVARAEARDRVRRACAKTAPRVRRACATTAPRVRRRRSRGALFVRRQVRLECDCVTFWQIRPPNLCGRLDNPSTQALTKIWVAYL